MGGAAACRWPSKRRHATDGAAWKAIKSIRDAGKGGLDLEPYRCGDHWHIGHSGKKFRARIRRALNRKD